MYSIILCYYNYMCNDLLKILTTHKDTPTPPPSRIYTVLPIGCRKSSTWVSWVGFREADRITMS